MIWTSVEEHVALVRKGEEEGRCPGCGREATTFASLFLPDHDRVGCYCAECIDGETIERLDPRQDSRLMKQAVIASDELWKAATAE